MLKKTITYMDLDGNSVSEEYYFAVSVSELVEMEAYQDGGLANMLKGIVDSKDPKAIYNAFKDILRKAIGERSEDGKRFVKSEAYTEQFLSSEAFNELFMEFLTDPNAIHNFFMGVLPKQLVDKLKTGEITDDLLIADAPARRVIDMPTEKDYETMTEDEMVAALVADVEEMKYEDFTMKELVEMPSDQFISLVGTNPRKMTKHQLMVAMQRKSVERGRATGARKNSGKF